MQILGELFVICVGCVFHSRIVMPLTRLHCSQTRYATFGAGAPYLVFSYTLLIQCPFLSIISCVKFFFISFYFYGDPDETSSILLAYGSFHYSPVKNNSYSIQFIFLSAMSITNTHIKFKKVIYFIHLKIHIHNDL